MADVATILGSVPADALGVTLMHEHVVPRAQIPLPEDLIKIKPRFAPRVGVDDYVRELRHVYEAYAVRSVVDCTPRRWPEELEIVNRIARETGLNIVVATGCMKEQYYHASRANVSNFWAYQLSSDEIADVLEREICSGIDGANVRAGIIKVGTSKERITNPEERGCAAPRGPTCGRDAPSRRTRRSGRWAPTRRGSSWRKARTCVVS